MNKKYVLIIVMLAVSVLSACYYDKEEELYAKPTTAEIKWSTTIKPIIDNNCATSGCHVAGAQSPDLSTYSAVFAKIDRVKARAVVERTMPTSGPLSQTNIDALSKWIDAGAPNN